MASLNLSLNGPSIKSSYQAVVNGPLSASGSPTYAQWALFTVQAPLISAFQDAGAKESVLKVQSTGDGELYELIQDFSEGRIQFAFVKVKDPNSGLPKCVLIGWCGGGVPERTKGYYTSHMAAVAKVLHGYHVQITARSEGDLAPDSIIQKVADSSGAKYSVGSSSPPSAQARPPVASKPVFTPSSRSGAGPMGSNTTTRTRPDLNVDKDGWGHDAPPVTRSQLEKVESAYKPTKVNMADFAAAKNQETVASASAGAAHQPDRQEHRDIVKGGYQPIGKVDIAAIRAQSKRDGDDRPVPVKGAYEPVGKVDIAAIRAKAQPRPGSSSQAETLSDRETLSQKQQQPHQEQERLVSLPKPKVAKKFVPSTSAFSGTKPPAPAPLGFSGPTATAAAPIGAASRTFADQGGKTPAQIWAERKAKEQGASAAHATPTPPTVEQTAGSEWKSGYTGKSWAPVQTGSYGRSLAAQKTGEDEPPAVTERRDADDAPASPGGGSVSALRDRFKGAQPIGAAPLAVHPAAPAPSGPPASNTSSSGFALPGLPTRAPQSPINDDQDETELADEMARPQSPVRIAIPVGRADEASVPPPVERHPPPPAPEHEIAEYIPEECEPTADDEVAQVARGAASAMADPASIPEPPSFPSAATGAGLSARVQYDYEKAEDNEVELGAGDLVTDIEMVDEDWWLGTNSRGERGLFPSNYVELLDAEATQEVAPAVATAPEPEPQPQPTPAPAGPTATALFDYEAAEDNEIGFPEGAKVIDLEFPDEDWWFGTYDGKSGLFPANYVQLDS